MTDTVQEDKIEELNEALMTKIQQVHTSKMGLYQDFLKSHCHEQHYTFQIKKCEDESCSGHRQLH